MSEPQQNHSADLSSLVERDRRYAALRASMEARSLEAVVVAARGDGSSRGRLNYLAGIKNFVEPCALLLLPLVGEPVLFIDPVRFYALPDWVPDVRSTVDLGAALGACLKECGLERGQLGTVAFDELITVRDWLSLRAAVPNATLEQADDVYESVSLVKTDTELAALETSARLVRRAAAALETILRPGARPAELVAEAQRSLHADGCTHAAVAFSRQPFKGLGCRSSGWLLGGTAHDPEPIGEDDLVVIEMDIAGPEGYCVEFRRCYRFKAFRDRERRFWEMRTEAFQAALELLRPGVDTREISIAIERVYARHGYDNRNQVSFHLHGTGVGAGEPPTCPGADRILGSGMTVVLHPLLRLERDESRELSDLAPADAVVVTETGPRRLIEQTNELNTIAV